MPDLLEKLLLDGAITQGQERSARRRIQRNGQSQEEALLALGFCPEEKVYSALSELSGLPLCNPIMKPPEPEALGVISQAMAQDFHCLPMELSGGILSVAFPQPPAPAQMDQLRLLTGYPCRPFLATHSSIDTYLKKGYGIGAEKVRKMRDQRVQEGQPAVTSTPSETDPAKNDSVTALVNEILDDALSAGATDIHLEPFAHQLKLRFRIDGLLQEVPTPPGMESFGEAIVSRLKVLAHLDITEKRLPHDGRLRFQTRDTTRDLRISILPTRYGETACLRILNTGNLMMGLDKLGFSEEHLTRLRLQLRHPNGLMLVTGPTGSGKTTTLYSLLSHLMGERPDLKFITVEDPVEYDIPGMTQIQIHAEIGLTFSTTLRSILRHDPDVILVGEIRDRETADIAIQAALTGHLVLSTLHTSDAVGAVNRLINMGVEPDLLASALRCVLAQRLLRKLCPHCSLEDRNVSREDSAMLESAARTLKIPCTTPRRASGAGCPHCRHTGYSGRIGVYEMMEVEEELEDLIAAHAPNTALHKAARTYGGWAPYSLDACAKVLQGITDLAEFHRNC